MKSVHIVIPDLFLPQKLAAYACADLRLPALEKLLTRAKSNPCKMASLEDWLCQQFDIKGLAIAPITLMAEGVQPEGAYWLRADPVGMLMQRDEMVLRSDVLLNAEEAEQLCKSLNLHFAADGFRFQAPHPQRWYLQLEHAPEMQTCPLPQAVGENMHAHLPYGAESLRWHSVINEVQMLFYDHPVNQAREQRGEAVVSGIWLWGGGMFAQNLSQPFIGMSGESELAQAFSMAAGIPVLRDCDAMLAGLSHQDGEMLLVFEELRNALQAADLARWRNGVKQFENNYAMPLLASLAAGKIDRITLDVLAGKNSQRFVLSRKMLWKLWRRPKPLSIYAFAQDSV